MIRTYLDLGTNVDRLASIARGLKLLGQAGRVAALSGVYESAAYGPPGQPAFYNMAILLETGLSPHELRAVLRQVETGAGRVRTRDRFKPRCLDLDILLYGNVVASGEGWQIPHPQLETQAFALVPLAELAPQAQHPVLQQTVADMLRARPTFRDSVRRVMDPLPL